MITVSSVEAREHLADIINRAAFGKERILLTRKGKDVVAVIPLEDLRLLENLENQIDILEATEALKEAEKCGTISLEQLKQQLFTRK